MMFWHTSDQRAYKRLGMTLVEIMVGVAIAGILAIIAVPRFLNSQSTNTGSITAKTESVIQMLTTAAEDSGDYPSTTYLAGTPINDSAVGDFILDNSNYMGLRTFPNGFTYILLSDGSRILSGIITLQQGYTFPQAPASSAGLTGLGTAASNLTPSDSRGQCGDFDNAECVYLDINGLSAPNTTGVNGDVIPLRFDPATGQFTTLYNAEKQESLARGWNYTPAYLCRWASVYDKYNGANCP